MKEQKLLTVLKIRSKSVTCYEGTLEDRANRIEQRRQKYSEYEQKCLEEIEQLTKQRDEALEKQEVKK